MLHKNTISNNILRPTHVSVDLTAITHNFNQIQSKAGPTKVMFVLKANAYGHGLIKIAQHLESLGAEYFGVAYLEEGIMLREADIKTPILVLGGIIGEQIPLFIEYDLTLCASSIEKLNQIEDAASKMGKEAKAHLKVDTGMERIGIHYYSAQKLLSASSSCKFTKIEGIFSHLANAENDSQYSQLQIDRFNEVLSFYERNNLSRPIAHINNSAGMLSMKRSKFEMIRIGLLLFGVFPNSQMNEFIDLNPALSWKTRVVYFKVVKAGHPVSYGSTWSAEKDTRIVTLPVGYGDGYMRSMSNKAKVLIRGEKYPIVGNICMDQAMVNIGQGTSYNGDEVILIGNQGRHTISVEDLAQWAGTIPYEILTSINTRVPRVYVNESL